LTLLEQTVERELPPPPRDLAAKQLARRGLADELGIRRIEALTRHRDANGHYLSTMHITLSGGDGQVLHGWQADLAPLAPAWACRSPDGCREPHVDGSSYCRKHHRLYRTPDFRRRPGRG
jgi:hypothetical protein